MAAQQVPWQLRAKRGSSAGIEAQAPSPTTSPVWSRARRADTLTPVVVYIFEALLVLSSLLITWFSVYVVYRLVTDEQKQ